MSKITKGQRGEWRMRLLMYLSDCMIPLLIVYIVAVGVSRKNPVYDQFVEGAREGLRTVVHILPTLVGLMIGVGVLRASGFLDFLSQMLQKPMELVGIPSQLVPVIIVRMFSSSAATGLVLDVFETYGPDSYIGTMASILMGCTETIFYTMSVYFMTAKITKTKWTLAGALFCTAAGIAASVLLAQLM